MNGKRRNSVRTSMRASLPASLPVYIVTAALAFVGLAGLNCFEGTEGEKGNFTFHDLTPDAGEWVQTDQSLSRPLAVGARMKLEVRDNGRSFVPDEVRSSAPDVVAVETNAAGYVLRALRAGEARITVGRGEDSDTVTVRAEAIAQTAILLYPLGELAADGGFADDGVVLTPGAKIWGFLQHWNAKGERLTGYGGGACTMDPNSGALFADEGSDRFSLQAPAEETPLTLSCGKAQVDLPVRSPDTAVRLEAYSYLKDEKGPAFIGVRRAQTQYIVVLARDADGQLVQGAAGEPVTLELPAEHQNYVTERTYDEDSAEMQSLFESNRVIALDFARTGQVELTVGWHGLALDLVFEVVSQ